VAGHARRAHAVTIIADMPEADGHPRPQSLRELFFAFSWLALQGFGGVLAVVQHELVERKRWFTREEFVEEWAVAQIMPGPNVVNLALMIGARYFGLRGAMTALAGMLAFPLLVVLALALVYAQFANVPQVAGALRGMGAVAAGLVTATGLKLFGALRKNPLGLPLCVAFGVATFVAVAVLRLPLAWVLLALGGSACGLAWRRLGATA
jgi:chromate transporter